MLKLIVEAKIACFLKLFLSLTELDFEVDPGFIVQEDPITCLDVVSELTRFVDDVIRKIDDLLRGKGSITRFSEDAEVFNHCEDTVHWLDQIEDEQSDFVCFFCDFLRSYISLCVKKIL